MYRGKYGYYYDDVPAELVNILVAGQAGDMPAVIAPLPQGTAAATPRGQRAAPGRRGGAQRPSSPSTIATALAPGMAFPGPALIEEASATTVVDCDAGDRRSTASARSPSPCRRSRNDRPPAARNHLAAADRGRRRDGDDTVPHRLLA